MSTDAVKASKSAKQGLKASAALNDCSLNDEILHLIKRGRESLRSGAEGLRHE